MSLSLSTQRHTIHSVIKTSVFITEVEVEANGTAVATAVEPEIILQQQSIQSFSPNPVMATAVEPEIQPQQQIVQSCTSTLGIPDAPVATDENTVQNNNEMLQKK